MEATLFNNVKKLYDYELYSEVIPLASILHTAHKHCSSLLSTEQEYQLLLFEANSFFNERQFRVAETYFRQIIQMKKSLIKQKNPTIASVENTYEHFSDSEVKYRLAVCLKEINRTRDAISILQSISNKSRTPKSNLLLAKLLQLDSKEKDAPLAFKDVLRDCPLSLGAIKSLLELGTNGIEVNSLVVNVSSTLQCSDWLSNWIKAHDLMYKRKFNQAIDAFKTINQISRIRNNEYLLALIGECYYYNGNYENALRFLQLANNKRPFMMEGLQSLAVLYSKKNKLQELEKLANTDLTFNEYTSEHWFVFAQCLYTANKYSKAAYFAQKAIHQNPRNVEAYLLKIKILFELKKYCEALSLLRNVQNISYWRFEVYKGLVNCYLAQSRIRDAQTVATHAVRMIGRTPRTLVLLSRSYSKDGTMKKKIKGLLLQALEIDEYYFPAVSMLADCLQNEGDATGAINLLKKQVAAHPHCKLYSMLGDILCAQKDFEKAFDNYTIALNLDPKNVRALEGLNLLGVTPKNNPTTKQEDTSYATAIATEDDAPIEYYSSPTFEIEIANNDDGGSESDTLWSDVEIEIN